MKKILLSFLLFSFSFVLYGYDFKEGGIYYNITSGTTVELTYLSKNVSSYSGDIVVPETVNYSNKTYTINEIGDSAFYFCTNITGVNLPNTVISVGYIAFAGCKSLSHIILPNSLTSIGEYAFSGCTSLDSLYIPENVKEILEGAFAGCSNLHHISLPDSLVTLGHLAFEYCISLDSFSIPESVKRIGGGCFWDCTNLHHIILPNSLVSIGERAFYYCTSLDSIQIPKNVKEIGEWCFEGCANLHHITLPDSLTSIGTEVFYNCISLDSIYIPQNVKKIGGWCFGKCTSLQHIVLPNSLTSIDSMAFSETTNLKTITLPEKVTYINASAFEQSGLQKITSLSLTPPNSDGNGFSGITPSNIYLYVPYAAIAAYKAHYLWKDFKIRALETIDLSYYDTHGNYLDSASAILYLPYDDEITVKATAGLPTDAYQWYYGVQGQGSIAFPACGSAETCPVRSIKGSDLFSASQFTALVKNHQKVEIQIENSYVDGDKKLLLTPILSSPGISATGISPRCSYQKGQIQVVLDRKPTTGEKFIVSVQSALYPTVKYTFVTDTLLISNCEVGDYTLQLEGSHIVYPTLKYTLVTDTLLADASSVADYTSQLGASSPTYETYFSGADRHKATVTVKGGIPELYFSSAKASPVSCFGSSDGSIQLSAEGGTGCLWVSLYNFQGHLLDTIRTTQGVVKSFQNLSAGVYFLGMIDEKGCPTNNSIGNIEIKQPEKLVITSQSKAVNCYGGSDGAISLSVQGGVYPYNYQWTANGTAYSRDSVLHQLPANKYDVQVKDANGCSEKSSVTLDFLSNIQLSESIAKNVTCANSQNGSIQVIPKDGVENYTVQWKDNTTADFLRENLSGGAYSATVTDGVGCTKDTAFVLTEPQPVHITFPADVITLCKDQSIDLNVEQASTLNPTYKWFRNNALLSTEPDITVTREGNYNVSVTTGNHCEQTHDFQVKQSSDVIVADFLMASKAKANDDVKVINISSPTMETTQWILPETSALTVSNQDESYADIRFSDYGTYTIGMKSMQGDCEMARYKTVEIVPDSELGDYEEGEEAFLQQFLVTPNPSDGNFAVTLEFAKTTEVRLVLNNLIQGIKLEERTLRGSRWYRENYQETLPSGQYVLQMITDTVRATYKLIIR